ncbi:MAG TPA: 6,7-dimethyl-8-ribityllumazine synthase [Dongiaceae bacterium]|jgi:6,7-dimethyl-8-ribityllumazine synthase
MADKPHILIVEARFYDDLLDAMLTGAKRVLDKASATYEIVTVPGALEIPGAIKFAHESGKAGRLERLFDGYVAIGCVIRGETTHYDTVCQESARGLMELAIHYCLAIGNGIITVENEEQAWARAKPDDQDKGGGAAKACLTMVGLKRRWGLE